MQTHSIRTTVVVPALLLLGFAIMGAPTCGGSDGRTTAEEVKESARRRQAKALAEEVEMAEILARVSEESVEVVVEPPVEWRKEIEFTVFLEREGADITAEYVAHWLEPRDEGARPSLMKWTDSVRIDGRSIGSRSRGDFTAADLLGLGRAPSRLPIDGRDSVLLTAAVEDGVNATEAALPLPPPLDSEDLLEVVSWRAADGTGRGLVFLADERAVADFERLRVDFDGKNWGRTNTLWQDRGPVVAFRTATAPSGAASLTGFLAPLELPLPPFAGVRLEAESRVRFDCEPLAAAPDWVSDRYPTIADPPLTLGLWSARSEVRGSEEVVLELWNAGRPREVVEVEGLVPRAWTPAGSPSTVLLARRASSTRAWFHGPYVWTFTNGATLEAEVDVDAGWRFREFSGGVAVFTRKVEVPGSFPSEYLDESLAVEIPLLSAES